MKIRGPGKSSGESVGNSSEQGLTPQRSYEPTGSIPTPTKGGQARNTRKISGPSYMSANEGPSEPKYNSRKG